MSECKARASATDPPSDCNWPFCGCDPAADKVLAAIQECDLVLVPMSALREVFSLAQTYVMQVPTRNPQRRMAIVHAFEECRKAVGELECQK